MKANEIMVGDWVVYQGDTEYTNPIKIEGMDIATDMLITSDREDVGFNGVEPIPLTAEILEKNGFERTNDYHFFDGDEYYEMELRELSDSIWLVEFTDLEFSMPSQRMIVCNVHELQHALKLCGIDKGIEP